MNGDSTFGSLARSARWFVFAKMADDRRRAVAWNLLARLHPSQMAERRSAVETLAQPPVEIQARTGFATAGGALANVSAVVDEARRIHHELRAEWRAGEKPYLLDHAITGLGPSSPLMRFALDRHVVAAAATYLGLVPRLTGITLLASPHVAGPLLGSQLFHSDWEDRRQVKVFVHCSPVDEENGPLKAVTAQASHRVKRELGYRYGGPDFRLVDERVEPLVSEEEVATFIGPIETVTLIDTSSCLHLGSRVQPGAEARLVIQFQYLTPAAFEWAFAYRPRRPFDPSAFAGADPLERLVLG